MLKTAIISSWKSKGLSAETIGSPSISNVGPYLIFMVVANLE